MEKFEIVFYSGYGGAGVKCDVNIDGVRHVLEIDEVKDIILGAIEMHGYKVEKTNRQKFPRLLVVDRTCAHFNCHKERFEGTDSCEYHQFCNCEKKQGKHYRGEHTS